MPFVMEYVRLDCLSLEHLIVRVLGSVLDVKKNRRSILFRKRIFLSSAKRPDWLLTHSVSY
jgi:hypothetical protein